MASEKHKVKIGTNEKKQIGLSDGTAFSTVIRILKDETNNDNVYITGKGIERHILHPQDPPLLVRAKSQLILESGGISTVEYYFVD